MRILCLTIRRAYPGSRRRRRVTSKPERLATAALLDAAQRDPAVMAKVIGKYGGIRVPEEDEMEAEIQNLRAKIVREAVQAVFKSRSRELDSRIGDIIDRVIGIKSGHGGGQHKEGRFKGVTTGGQNSAQTPIRQRQRMRQGLRHRPSRSSLVKDLEALALLGKLAGRQIRNEGRGGNERTNAVGHNR